MSQRKLLLLSSSRTAGQQYLEHARPLIRAFLPATVRRLLFIPYASVTRSFDDYEKAVQESLSGMGLEITSIHRTTDPKEAVVHAEAIAIGGGNTFQLLRYLYEQAGVLGVIRDRVMAGIPYIGWSAGSNVACPTIRTTNDMPIVEPPRLTALGLVPFQINPHYLNEHPESHHGETREERILEFIKVNPGVTVVGLREGSALQVMGETIELLGDQSVRLFVKGADPREYYPGESLQMLIS